MKYIVNQVKKLVKKYNTNDPFELCSALGINISVSKLPQHMSGFYTTIFDIPFIFLSSAFDDCEKRAVCAHELGHSVLHRSTNTLFIQKNTLISPTKLEKKADFFAAELLIGKITCFDECSSIRQLAFEYNVPTEYMQIKYDYMN